MIDLMSAARVAIYAALSAAPPAGVQVFDDLPENTQPPFLKIGSIDSDNQGRPGEQYEVLTVEVIAVYRGSDRGKLLAMMHAARVALDWQPLTASGAMLNPARYLKGSASDASQQDGVTFAGILNFEVIAQA